MRAEIFFLRLFGFILSLIGGIQWYLGGLSLPVTVKNVSFSLPLHLALIFLGALLLLIPRLPVQILLAIPFTKKSKSLEAYLLKLISDNDPPEDAAELAQYVKGFIRWNTFRFWAVLLVATLTFFSYIGFVQPYLTKEAVEKAAFASHSAGLLQLLQESPLDFSSTDLFRRQLHAGSNLMELPRYRNSASYEIYRILQRLYSPSVVDSSTFDRQFALLYEEEIRPHIEPDTGVLKDSAFESPFDPDLESSSSKVVLLTLRGIICNEQGAQGRYIEPYLQGRQLLKRATAIADGLENIAYTHNALGVNYADSLRCHTSYSQLLSRPTAAAKKVAEAIGEIQPLSPLSIARSADKAYNTAYSTSSNNFARARYLNNGADLRISLLQQSHLKGVKLQGHGGVDDNFLTENVDPPRQGDPNWRPANLPRILARLKSDLDAAVRLDQNPRIYFTRAQLFALAGSLSEIYKVPTYYLRPTEELCEAGIADLRTAASLGLYRRYFSVDRAAELGLDWLWRCDDAKNLLGLLSIESAGGKP